MQLNAVRAENSQEKGVKGGGQTSVNVIHKRHSFIGRRRRSRFGPRKPPRLIVLGMNQALAFQRAEGGAVAGSIGKRSISHMHKIMKKWFLQPSKTNANI